MIRSAWLENASKITPRPTLKIKRDKMLFTHWPGKHHLVGKLKMK